MKRKPGKPQETREGNDKGKYPVPAFVPIFALVFVCVFVFLILLFASRNNHAVARKEDFGELFERCRIAVEQSVSLNTKGLQSMGVHEEHARSMGSNASQIGWALPNSSFYIVFTSWKSRNGTTRRQCDVKLQEPNRRLSEDEQGQLLRYFLLRQTRLIAEGTHKPDRQLSPVPPIMNLGFLLSAPNPAGCTVINNMALLPDGSFFQAGVGEQSIKACGAN